jgi:predicted kinase
MKKLLVFLQKKAPLWVYTIWHMKEKLTLEQEMLGQALITEGSKRRPPSPPPRLFVLIGLVGAGKSSVAKYIAEKREGTIVVNANDIRLRLRKIQNSYANDRLVGEFTIFGLLNRGYSVVADSDHGDERKRKSLLSQLKDIQDLKIEVHYIRVYADFEVIAQRIFEKTKYEGETIYSVAVEGLKDRISSAVIRLREFWRRTPHHYDWIEEVGGQWKLKEPPVPLLADLDTGSDWQKELDKALATLV